MCARLGGNPDLLRIIAEYHGGTVDPPEPTDSGDGRGIYCQVICKIHREFFSGAEAHLYSRDIEIADDFPEYTMTTDDDGTVRIGTLCGPTGPVGMTGMTGPTGPPMAEHWIGASRRNDGLSRDTWGPGEWVGADHGAGVHRTYRVAWPYGATEDIAVPVGAELYLDIPAQRISTRPSRTSILLA